MERSFFGLLVKRKRISIGIVSASVYSIRKNVLMFLFENLLTCLGPYSESMAGKFGYDWGDLNNTIKAIWKKLHQLQEADLLLQIRLFTL